MQVGGVVLEEEKGGRGRGEGGGKGVCVELDLFLRLVRWIPSKGTDSSLDLGGFC